jgi:hypothetical protein
MCANTAARLWIETLQQTYTPVTQRRFRSRVERWYIGGVYVPNQTAHL